MGSHVKDALSEILDSKGRQLSCFSTWAAISRMLSQRYSIGTLLLRHLAGDGACHNVLALDFGGTIFVLNFGGTIFVCDCPPAVDLNLYT
jgi:hypothetical protein